MSGAEAIAAGIVLALAAGALVVLSGRRASGHRDPKAAGDAEASAPRARGGARAGDREDAGDPDAAGKTEPIEMPIDGTLDLHLFSPKEVGDLIPEFIAECRRRGIYEVRIIHGKGKGVLRRTTWAILERHPHVVDFEFAGRGGGNWGATEVRLRGRRRKQSRRRAPRGPKA